VATFRLPPRDPSAGDADFGAAAPEAATSALLRRQLADERARCAALAEKCRAAEARRARAEAELAKAAAELDAIRRELLTLEDAVRPNGASDAADDRSQQLRGARVLYVGAGPKLIGQLRAMVASRGGELLAHDGGIDDNPALLPGFVAQADVVFYPLDGVSDAAAERLKRLCRRVAKPWRALRSASLASFVAQIADGQAAPKTRLIEAAE
jgi:hypothetical protein